MIEVKPQWEATMAENLIRMRKKHKEMRCMTTDHKRHQCMEIQSPTRVNSGRLFRR